MVTSIILGDMILSPSSGCFSGSVLRKKGNHIVEDGQIPSSCGCKLPNQLGFRSGRKLRTRGILTSCWTCSTTCFIAVSKSWHERVLFPIGKTGEKVYLKHTERDAGYDNVIAEFDRCLKDKDLDRKVEGGRVLGAVDA